MNQILALVSTLTIALATATTVDPAFIDQVYAQNMSKIQQINDLNYSQTEQAAAIMFEAQFGRPPVDTEELIQAGYIKRKNVING